MNNKFKIALNAVVVAFICAGCASSKWYQGLGLNESDLHEDKAIIAAVQVYDDDSISKSDRNSAMSFLYNHQITPLQAELLVAYVDQIKNQTTLGRVMNLLIRNGYLRESLPVLLKAVQSNVGGVRVGAAKNLGKLGCDAKAALPVLYIISKRDKFDIERIASASIRTIEIDCFAKNHPLDAKAK